MSKSEWVDKLIDFIGRIGVPSAVVAALLYELHTFLQQSLINQTVLLKNQEVILDFIRQLVRGLPR